MGLFDIFHKKGPESSATRVEVPKKESPKAPERKITQGEKVVDQYTKELDGEIARQEIEYKKWHGRAIGKEQVTIIGKNREEALDFMKASRERSEQEALIQLKKLQALRFERKSLQDGLVAFSRREKPSKDFFDALGRYSLRIQKEVAQAQQEYRESVGTENEELMDRRLQKLFNTKLRHLILLREDAERI